MSQQSIVKLLPVSICNRAGESRISGHLAFTLATVKYYCHPLRLDIRIERKMQGKLARLLLVFNLLN